MGLINSCLLVDKINNSNFPDVDKDKMSCFGIEYASMNSFLYFDDEIKDQCYQILSKITSSTSADHYAIIYHHERIIYAITDGEQTFKSSKVAHTPSGYVFK